MLESVIFDPVTGEVINRREPTERLLPQVGRVHNVRTLRAELAVMP